ncbi:hypothetical protein AB9G26_08995 [Francisella philomiragia]|uniref:hypothetical protein n=1 Tax=Francisella philomiragia TaxID=28110 RepID=UPI003514E8D3
MSQIINDDRLKRSGESYRDLSEYKLFERDPSIMDIQQGRLGDCSLLASIGSVLIKDWGAAFIKGLFKETKKTVEVELFYNNTLYTVIVRKKMVTAARSFTEYLNRKDMRQELGKHVSIPKSQSWIFYLETAAHILRRNFAANGKPSAFYSDTEERAWTPEDAFKMLFGSKISNIGTINIRNNNYKNNTALNGTHAMELINKMPLQSTEEVFGGLATDFICFLMGMGLEDLNGLRQDNLIDDPSKAYATLFLPLLGNINLRPGEAVAFRDAITKILNYHLAKDDGNQCHQEKMFRKDDLEFVLRVSNLDMLEINVIKRILMVNDLNLPGKRGTGVYNNNIIKLWDFCARGAPGNNICTVLGSNNEVGRKQTAKGYCKEMVSKGLAGKHAYTVLSVFEYNDLKFVRVFNPWGISETRFYTLDPVKKTLKAHSYKNDRHHYSNRYVNVIADNDQHNSTGCSSLEITDVYKRFGDATQFYIDEAFIKDLGVF